MSSINGNGGMRYYTSTDEDAPTHLSDTQLDTLAAKVAKHVEPTTGINLKSISIIIGLLLAVGSVVWGASALTSSKANAVDVIALDKTLGQIQIVLEGMAGTIDEIKKDIDALEKSTRR